MVSWQPYSGVEYTLSLKSLLFSPASFPGSAGGRALTPQPASPQQDPSDPAGSQRPVGSRARAESPRPCEQAHGTDRPPRPPPEGTRGHEPDLLPLARCHLHEAGASVAAPAAGGSQAVHVYPHDLGATPQPCGAPVHAQAGAIPSLCVPETGGHGAAPDSECCAPDPGGNHLVLPQP